MKTRIVIEVKKDEVVSIGQIGYVEVVDEVEIILIEHSRPDKKDVVCKLVPDWQSPTAAEMYIDEPEVQKQIKKIEEEE